MCCGRRLSFHLQTVYWKTCLSETERSLPSENTKEKTKDGVYTPVKWAEVGLWFHRVIRSVVRMSHQKKKFPMNGRECRLPKLQFLKSTSSKAAACRGLLKRTANSSAKLSSSHFYKLRLRIYNLWMHKWWTAAPWLQNVPEKANVLNMEDKNIQVETLHMWGPLNLMCSLTCYCTVKENRWILFCWSSVSQSHFFLSFTVSFRLCHIFLWLFLVFFEEICIS